jgi:molybdenum cofactor cytidylyltransferase
MGGNKLFFRLAGETMVKRTVKCAIAAGLNPIIVTVGHDSDQVSNELAGLPIRTVLNPDHARGLNRSLKTGIEAIPGDVSAVVVLLADMPLVTSRMVAALVQRYRESSAPLVVSDYAGVQAPPTLYDRSLFPELGGMEGEGSGKQVVRRHAEEAVSVSWPAAALADIDRPEDYQRALALLDGEGKAPTS